MPPITARLKQCLDMCKNIIFLLFQPSVADRADRRQLRSFGLTISGAVTSEVFFVISTKKYSYNYYTLNKFEVSLDLTFRSIYKRFK